MLNDKLKEYLETRELYDILDEISELLGCETLLDELAKAMSTNDLQDYLEFITRLYNI